VLPEKRLCGHFWMRHESCMQIMFNCQYGFYAFKFLVSDAWQNLSSKVLQNSALRSLVFNFQNPNQTWSAEILFPEKYQVMKLLTNNAKFQIFPKKDKAFFKKLSNYQYFDFVFGSWLKIHKTLREFSLLLNLLLKK
jgi:hypothetical protein